MKSKGDIRGCLLFCVLFACFTAVPPQVQLCQQADGKVNQPEENPE